MNISSIATIISKKHKILKKDSVKIVTEVFDLIGDSLAKRVPVKINGFGSFQISNRKARIVHDPNDPSINVNVPAKKVPVLRAYLALKAKVDHENKKLYQKY